MKKYFKILYLFLIIFLPALVFGQSYQAQLKKLNDYLKTFDNGYYGYFEVKDGYLYGRFPSGKYSKVDIDKLGKATVAETNRKVTVPCNDGTNCVFSTYTDSYHAYMQFSQSKDFNTAVLVGLFDDLTDALQGKSTKNTLSQQDRLQKQQERLGEKQETGQQVLNPDRSKYVKQLNALNTYLKTFNPETYGDVTVKEGKVFFEFKFYSQKHYSSIPISDLTQKTIITKGSTLGKEEVKIQCKGESDCFYSTYTKENTDHFRFFSNTVKDLTKMKQLVDDFIQALK